VLHLLILLLFKGLPLLLLANLDTRRQAWDAHVDVLFHHAYLWTCRLITRRPLLTVLGPGL
jgi:hypothetical protein